MVLRPLRTRRDNSLDSLLEYPFHSETGAREATKNLVGMERISPFLLLKIRPIEPDSEFLFFFFFFFFSFALFYFFFLPPTNSISTSVELGMSVPLNFNGEWLTLNPLSPISSSVSLGLCHRT